VPLDATHPIGLLAPVLLGFGYDPIVETMSFKRFALFSSLVVNAACGGAAPAPQAPAAPSTHAPHHSSAEVSTNAEIGALPEEETQYALKTTFKDVQACFFGGSRRVEFLGGEIAFNITVGSDGKAVGVFAERTTLGDRETEKCMIDAMKHVSWPKPVGGPIGIAQGSFDFEAAADVRPPVSWQESKVSAALHQAGGRLSQCKTSSATGYLATVYVDENGKPLAAGVAAPNRDAEGASDCLVDVLLSLSFPDPGSWPAKVSFSI
jgi:hypothetical protein